MREQREERRDIGRAMEEVEETEREHRKETGLTLAKERHRGDIERAMEKVKETEMEHRKETRLT